MRKGEKKCGERINERKGRGREREEEVRKTRRK